MMRLVISLFLMALLPGVAAASGQCGPQDDVPEADRLANNVRWTTASEQDNFGYNVYRGLSEDGPFDKVTETPILGHGTTDETSKYAFRDSSIDPCKAYWYYVESVSTHGVRERFTPVVRVAPKLEAAKPASQAAPADENVAEPPVAGTAAEASAPADH